MIDKFKGALAAEIQKKVDETIEENSEILKGKDTFTASEYGAFKYGDGFIDGLRKAQDVINSWSPEEEADD